MKKVPAKSKSKIEDRSYIEALWKTKLTSRNSFLMIFEFMKLPLASIEHALMVLIGKPGKKFCMEYLKKGKQFRK